MKINRRNAERELTLKLHHNFGEGDIHAVLTYSGEEPKKGTAEFLEKAPEGIPERGQDPEVD